MDLTAFFETIGQWFSDNGTVFSISTIFVALSGWVVWYFTKRVVPNLAKKILMFVANVLGRLLGVDPDKIVSGVETLPIVEDLKREHEARLLAQEQELVKIKTRLISGKLTDAERISQEYIFDMITKDLGDKISKQTLEVLEKLEKSRGE